MRQDPNLFSQREIFSVSQLVTKVKFQLETSFRKIWVRGEISNFRVPPSGHFYFSLKDDNAQIKAVCFRLQNRSLGFLPEDGMDIIARGTLSVYPPRGDFQLVVESIEPIGRGALQIAFEQLKSRLDQEGLFDLKHKKQLPLLPEKIGLVTSPTGAAIQDILRVLKRRNDRLDILIFPVKVQGPGASQEIAEAIQHLNRRGDLDVIIVGRGGGSWEDLWAFSDEQVARAVFESQIPIISAVGHETDFTISDFVADLRAATPSAAAEMVSGVRTQLYDHVQQLIRQMAQVTHLLLNQKRQGLQQVVSSRVFVDAESRLRLFAQRLDELYSYLTKALPARLAPARQKVRELERDLSQFMSFYLHSRKQLAVARGEQLQAYSPLAVLNRGYALVTTESNQIVRDPAQVAEGETVDIQVARGRFRVKKEPNGRV